ncbi:prepilin-type N-terminal cleavage/methylation domain-containing protein [Candidatus Omnitrophota bacterium]
MCHLFLRLPKKLRPSKSFRSRFPCNRGFTLIEIMVTVAILSFGILAIYESFFISIDAFSYYTNYLNAQGWAGEKVWEIQNKLLRLDSQMVKDNIGTFTLKNKDFNWGATIKPIAGQSGAYRLDVLLFWKEGSRERCVHRTVYAISQLEKYEEF